MSLNWNWEDKIGECVYDNGQTSNIYRGNAFMIATTEYPDDTYTLAWFAADKNHMKNLLGLTKGCTNVFMQFGIVEMSLSTKYPETAEMCAMLAKAKMNITIKLGEGY